MRCTGAPQRGHGWPNRPCTAISLRNAVTFSGKRSPVSARRRSIHPASVARAPRAGARSRSSVEPRRQRERRQPRAVQDLVRVRVADAAQDARVGERALQRVVLALRAPRRTPRAARRGPRCRRGSSAASALGRARACSDARFFAPASVRSSVPSANRSAASVVLARGDRARVAPMQPSRDHQVQRRRTGRSSSAKTIRLPRRSTADHRAPSTAGDRRIDRCGRRIGELRTRSSTAPRMRTRGFDVDRDVGKLRHGSRA